MNDRLLSYVDDGMQMPILTQNKMKLYFLNNMMLITSKKQTWEKEPGTFWNAMLSTAMMDNRVFEQAKWASQPPKKGEKKQVPKRDIVVLWVILWDIVAIHREQKSTGGE